MKLWLGSWLPCGPSINFATKNLSLVEIKLPIACFYDKYGNWDLDSLTDFLPMEVLQKIISYSINSSNTDTDKCFWILTSNEEFSIKFAYESQSATNLSEKNK